MLNRYWIPTRLKILVLLTALLFGFGENSEIYCGNVTIHESNLNLEWKRIIECQVIEGNLRIHHCKFPRHLSLPNLVQVTGYVILEWVEGLQSLSDLFPRLSVVRGRSLFENTYSFILDANLNLQEIGPWSFTNIIRGSVRIQDNILLCTDEDIEWKKLIEPQYWSTNIFKNNRDFCPFVGCEEEGICKIRSKTCTETGLPCPSYKKCHPECLGGCYYAEDDYSCVACRHFLMDGQCVQYCPSTHLNYLGYRCVSVEYCLRNNGSVFYSKSSIGFSTMCNKQCPAKFVTYKIHQQFENHGKIKTCEPRPICETSNLHSRDLGDSLRLCTRINGNLIIRVSEGRNVSRRLEENLGSIQVVTGYVMVVGANALYSLSFLTNLTSILGEEKVYTGTTGEGYAFYILENENLKEFWGLNKKRIKIRGSIFVSFNDQLCPVEIERLREVTGHRKENVAANLNGRKAQCKIYQSSLSAVPGVERGSMILTWMHTYCGVDNRYVLGYEIFYRPTNDFVSFYHQRDVCNDRDLWSREFLKIPVTVNNSECLKYEVKNLTPNTRYAFYVRSLGVDDIQRAIQSDIAYNVTNSINPRKPREGKTELTGDKIELSWRNSLSLFSAASQIFYEVLVSVKSDFNNDSVQFLPHCQITTQDLTNVNEVEESEIGLTNSIENLDGQCSCGDDSSYIKRLLSQRKERIDIEKEIDRLLYTRFSQTELFLQLRTSGNSSHARSFENLRNSSDYSKPCDRNFSLPEDCPLYKPDFTKSSLPYSNLKDQYSWKLTDSGFFSWSSRTIEQYLSIPFPKSLNFRKVPTRINAMVRACLGKIDPCPPLNSSHPCALCSPFASWTKHEVVYDGSLNLTVTTELAQNNGSVSIANTSGIQCPSFVLEDSTAVITKLLVNHEEELHMGLEKSNGELKAIHNFPDSVDAFNYSIQEETEMGAPVLRLSWVFPVHLEPVILGFRILYRKIDGNKNEVTQICLPKFSSDLRNNSLALSAVHGQSYQVGIQVRTLAGYGPINQKCISVPWDRQTELLVYISCVVGACLFVLLLVGVYLIVRRKRNVRGEIENKYYGVTWLEYIHSHFHLAPNQLHINFDNVLGGGQFGMVYEGTLTKDNGCKTQVAVKTIRESEEQEATNIFPDHSREEKIQALLKEAVIMQDFNCSFIVQLEGVAEDALGLPSDRESSLYVALEFMSGGDLKSYLNYRKQCKELLDVLEMVEISIQVADGMAYLSSKNFQHRDLAARNCMIARRGEQFVVKIGDFGLTRYLKEDYYYFPKQNKPLPVRWMAPETLSDVASDGKYSFWSDVWSFGVLLFEILTTGDKPYELYSNEVVLEKVRSGDLVLRSPDNRSPLLSSLMELCLQRTPRQRPSFCSLITELLPETSERFYSWFKERSYFHSSSSLTSGGTDACDEGFFAGSLIDSSQDEANDPSQTLDRLKVRINRNNNNNIRSKSSTDEDISSTPSKTTDSCWTLPCGPRRLQEKRCFSFSGDALLE